MKKIQILNARVINDVTKEEFFITEPKPKRTLEDLVMEISKHYNSSADIEGLNLRLAIDMVIAEADILKTTVTPTNDYSVFCPNTTPEDWAADTIKYELLNEYIKK